MNTALSSLLREHYHALDGYVSAGMESGKDAQRVFMNANENPFELPGLESYNRYPEPQPPALRQAYASAYKVEDDWIVMTRGADEAIVLLSRLFCEPSKDAAIICTPTFGMYGVNTRAQPAQALEIPLLQQNGSFELNAEQIISTALKPNSKMIFLCSPNNPTGNSFDQQVIERICRSTLGHSIVVLDETYIEFSKLPSMTRLLQELPNLIILRTLSKAYSMAGMRMGSLLNSDSDFIRLLRSKCLDAYPLPLASIEAAKLALSANGQAAAKANISILLAERQRLEHSFSAAHWVRQVFPSDANFLLIEMESAQEFLSFCADQQIVLRDFSKKPETRDCLRISVGTPEQNDRLITLVEQYNSAG